MRMFCFVLFVLFVLLCCVAFYKEVKIRRAAGQFR